ncbi:ABC transporter permease subunit/CPBP intramembrane protease [Bythopirellula polymerisocia]|uniref:ABC-2 family transporter protein n=1 Tax=Bythopirellula polymerisocia TaxID=2528003 RepID=A0A5C6CV13_9BACT|nr:ABC transporter permease subunit/CPBP intramembrane protease [Bythopirellula polymerisocia]TWU27271.1 ABC-2 family transporter protein [Bythopirellula polymerisocia]
MNLHNVKLVYAREMRDQLRDRRTLFLIAVLPLLLYPLLGMSFFQLSQFMRNNASKVLVLGEEQLAGSDWLPQLFDEDHFASSWFSTPKEQDVLQLVRPDTLWPEGVPIGDALDEAAREAISQGEVQVVLRFPRGFEAQLEAVRESLMNRSQTEPVVLDDELLQTEIIFISANEKSRIAQLRVDDVLRQWRAEVTRSNLAEGNVPITATNPFLIKQNDVSHEQQRHAAVWSKVLPFVLFIWALTGAFYPAIDLCAGEKERGTLETLLVSPAERREIVWGKLLTIMTFSVITALLNLASLGVTAKFILAQFSEIISLPGASALTLPPLSSLIWLVVALLPIAAFFSAMCLACAAFARSTKEGQYYLMPLLLVVMPLMMLPLSPGVELTLGNSLIPVTGVVLLLRSVIEGQYVHALKYVIPVVGVTFGCCLLAIRWAEDQFNRESVLFRESERLDLGRWLTHLFRDRADTPTLAQAILCIVVVSIVQFFVSLSLSAQEGAGTSFHSLAQLLFISQVVCIALPAGLMTLLFTRRPARTLLLDRWPRISHVLAAAGLAVLMFPLGQQFAQWVELLYPVSNEVKEQIAAFSSVMQTAPNWWLPLVLIGLLPAICEEIAFRGFILSGLRHLGHKWWAISISAIAFGMAHFILQQKVSAAAVGLVIGVLAVQTGSLIPCIVFHAIYNSLTVLSVKLAENLEAWMVKQPKLDIFFRTDNQGFFQDWVILVCLCGSAGILWWLHRIPYHRTDEEQLQENLDKQFVGA